MADQTSLAKARKARFNDLPNFPGYPSEDIEHFLKSIKNPGQRVRAGSCRKTPEINGTWKQYSGRKNFGFFSCQFLFIPIGTDRKLPGICPKNVRPEYCFHVPLISGVFLLEPDIFPALSRRFLQYPVAGTIDLGILQRLVMNQTTMKFLKLFVVN